MGKRDEKRGTESPASPRAGFAYFVRESTPPRPLSCYPDVAQLAVLSKLCDSFPLFFDLSCSIQFTFGGQKMKWTSRSVTHVMGSLGRTIEVVLGLVLSAVTLMMITGWVVSGWLALNGQLDGPSWELVPGFLLFSALTWWLGITSWCLLTGHERRGGGLLTPTILVIAGVASLFLAGLILWRSGVAGALSSYESVGLALVFFGVARARYLRAHRHGRRTTG